MSDQLRKKRTIDASMKSPFHLIETGWKIQDVTHRLSVGAFSGQKISFG